MYSPSLLAARTSAAMRWLRREHRPINAFAEQKLDHTINLAWARDLHGPMCCTIRCRQTVRRLIDAKTV
jgi:hypothetical protein